MDFGALLSIAQKNENKQMQKACYQTKFTPPKKESKQTKNLSENIKKFLAKKEEEERQKALEEKRKKENLLALRDQKTQNKINKHLKVCKAANKSVLADAVDNENTAITIAGPSQCDEDDYGYVSQEASAFYNKLMNKYGSMPPEKSIFSESVKKPIKDIASTKDRVKQALKQQELEATLPHRRKRKHKDSESDGKHTKDSEDGNSREKERDREIDRDEEPEEEKPKIKRKPMPPPIDFSELLKLAEKKQYEPIKIEPKPKPKEEPERLMTKKQMKEYAKEKDWRDRKEQRIRNPESAKTTQSTSDNKSSKSTTKPLKPNSTTMSDVNHDKTVSKTLPVISKKPTDRLTDKNISTNKTLQKTNVVNKSIDKNNSLSRSSEKSNNVSRSVTEKSNGFSKTSLPKVSERDAIAEERRKLEEEKRKLEEMRRSIEEEKKKLLINKSKKVEDSRSNNSLSSKSVGSKPKDTIKPSSSSLSKNSTNNGKSRPFPPSDVKPRQFPPADVKPRQFPPADVKPRQFPPADVKPRQFPPPDVRSSKSKQNSSKLKVVPNRRRIYDEDDEEYDSEFDDFIDDGPVEEREDVSKYISEIFGYDKNKYSYLDDEDDAAMESNYAQQLKEEFISTKIGIEEDLEDMRQEAMEKKRKAILKKKR